MNKLPKQIRQYFYQTIYGKVTLHEFENWIYTNKSIESLIGEDQYLELISFNYKKDGAKYELVNLLSEKFIGLGDYEKWKLLNSLNIALLRDNRLANVLREFYDLYCYGYHFLNDLGLGYGLTIEVPPTPQYNAESWEELSKNEQNEILESFYPQLQLDIERTIEWIENGKIILTGTKDEIGNYEYEDLRTELERKSTVWVTYEEQVMDRTKLVESQSKMQVSKITGTKFKGGLIAKLKRLFN
ncbi:hypothetical protein [Crocinitomix catalasitica]|uniref:hypothetical protein n=1 Tax=Crocinitomix catalasitica TaxID=184607 RepID=UPI0004846CA3|nr:hypothetical protein [Crocinitomix catalasitica]